MRFIKANAIVKTIETDFIKQLVEIKKKILVAANSSTVFTALVGYDTYDVRTVYATNDTGDPITLSIFDSAAQENEIYRSLAQSVINDIVAVPCRDKAGTKSLTVRLVNNASTNMNVSILIKVVNL